MTFLPATQLIENPAASRSCVFLHGALGSGQNFRSLATKLAKRRPDHRCVLVDLPHHGKSRPFPGPDTLAACARATVALIGQLDAPGACPVSTLIGHSLGGKIALEVARQGAPLSQVWVLDANPGPQAPSSGGEVGRVIAALRKIPLPIETRADIAQLLLDEGLSPAIANWMTTNLERTDGGYGWALDIDGIHALLLDYAASDHWPFLDSRHQDDLDLRIVVAERSDRLDQEARAHFERLASRGQLGYQLLPDAGHWLHVDNPEGLLALLAKNLPTA